MPKHARPRRRTVPLLAAAALAAVVAVAVALTGGGDDGSSPDAATGSRSTTTAAGSSTTAATSQPGGTFTVTAPPEATTPPPTTAPGAPAASGLRLDPGGLGPVRVGMTQEAAGAALGRTLRPLGPGTDSCRLLVPDGELDGVALMVSGGTVARVDVLAPSVPTAEGAAVGQPQEEARRRYGPRITDQVNPAVPGGRLLVVPGTGDAAALRLVLETDGTTVTALRAGRLPEVDYPAGCPA